MFSVSNKLELCLRVRKIIRFIIGFPNLGYSYSVAVVYSDSYGKRSVYGKQWRDAERAGYSV